jgi:hypothetical protein
MAKKKLGTARRVVVSDEKVIWADAPLYRNDKMIRILAAKVERALTRDQRDMVLQLGGRAISALEFYRLGSAILTNERTRTKKATEERKNKSQKRRREWQDAVDPLAAKAWRKSPDYPAFHPWKLAASIVRENAIDAEEDTIARYLRKYEARVKSFG